MKAEMSQDKKSKRARRREKIQREIETIQEAALEGGEDNRISLEISFAQAASVRFRSLQLIRESESHPTTNPRRVAEQIEECWKMHAEGRA